MVAAAGGSGAPARIAFHMNQGGRRAAVGAFPRAEPTPAGYVLFSDPTPDHLTGNEAP